MAQPATIQVSAVSKPDLTRRKKRYYYAIAMADPGAPTYPAGGVVVNLSYSNVLNPLNIERHAWSSARLPMNYDIESYGANFGYLLNLQQAAVAPTMANFVLRIYTAAGDELGTNSAIPASLFAALIANAPQLFFELRGPNWLA